MAKIRTEIDGDSVEVEADSIEEALSAYAKVDVKFLSTASKLCLSLNGQGFCAWVKEDLDPEILQTIFRVWDEGKSDEERTAEVIEGAYDALTGHSTMEVRCSEARDILEQWLT